MDGVDVVLVHSTAAQTSDGEQVVPPILDFALIGGILRRISLAVFVMSMAGYTLIGEI